MIQSTAVRAIIAIAVFAVGWWLVGYVFFKVGFLGPVFGVLAFALALAFAVWVFLDLKRSDRDRPEDDVSVKNT